MYEYVKHLPATVHKLREGEDLSLFYLLYWQLFVGTSAPDFQLFLECPLIQTFLVKGIHLSLRTAS